MPKCSVCNTDIPDSSVFCLKCGNSLTGGGQTGKLNTDTILENRYVIVKTLGRGGMGAVYLALDQRLNNTTVAIKEMSTNAVGTGNLQAAIGAFKKEASMLIGMRHPGLPVIRDFFPKGEERWYLVMDYIQGDNLQHIVDQRGTIPEAEVLDWARQIGEILSYLHSQNPPIIFRDLKPANIMLTPQGQIKIIDFGIARHFQKGNTTDTSYYGSQGFAPPEQYGENQTDPRSDIYSLGANMHYFLTGINPMKNPFVFDPPSKTVNVSKQTEAAIMKALEMRAENRPKNMQEMLGLLPVEVNQKEKQQFRKSTIKEEAHTVGLNTINHKFSMENATLPISEDFNGIQNQSLLMNNNKTKSSTVKKKVGRNKILIIVACLLLLLSGGYFSFKYIYNYTAATTPIIDSTQLDSKYGNSVGNIINSGFTAQKGDWIYYGFNNAVDTVYKVRTDGSQRIKLSNDNALDINVVGDWVYYCICEGGIGKVKTDGSQRTILYSDGSADYINVVGDWIYYCNAEGEIRKIKTDGSQNTILSSSGFTALNVVANWIYYLNGDDNQNIYKMKTDGTQRTKVNNDYSSCINVVGNWIYYLNGDDNQNIYKMKTDGTQRTKINDEPSDCINVVGDWIYYLDNNSNIYKIKIDGTLQTQLNTDISGSLNIAGDWIYYRCYINSDDKFGKVYRMKTDGSERQLAQ